MRATTIGAGLVATIALAVAGCSDQPEPPAKPVKQAKAAAAADPSCAARFAQANGGRIVGGEPAKPGSAPWQAELFSSPQYSERERAFDATLARGDPCKVYLAERAPFEIAHKCGGAYIGDGWVITAAHCVANLPTIDGRPGDVLVDRKVRLGTQNLTAGGAVYAIDAVVIHEGYVARGRLDDIALIRLKEEGQTATLLAAGRLAAIPLVMPADRDFDAGEDLRVTGWGWMGRRAADAPTTRLDSAGNLQRNPAELQQVSLNYLPDATCAAEYGDRYGPGALCAGSTDPAKDSCQGDSGGPLTRDDGGRRVLAGLVSNGKGCATGLPAVYTRVSAYDGWIVAAKRRAVSGRVVPDPRPVHN